MATTCIEILVLLAICTVSDVKTRKIKNSVTYTFIAVGMFANTAANGLKGLGFSLAGVCIPLLILLLFYKLRMLGAGDVKLFAAVGAIAGGRFVFRSILYSFLFGGVAGIITLALRRNATERFKSLLEYIKSCYLTFRLMEYENSASGNSGGRFPFTYAAVPGILLQLLPAILGTQVVETWI